MGLFDFLFGSGEDPQQEIDDMVLGKLSWSEGDESWVGKIGDIAFTLAYEKRKLPLESVVNFARTMLNEPDWVGQAVGKAKSQAKLDKPPLYHQEIENLSIDMIHICRHSRHKNKIFMLMQFKGGCDDRSWRADFVGDEFIGVGFDT